MSTGGRAAAEGHATLPTVRARVTLVGRGRRARQAQQRARLQSLRIPATEATVHPHPHPHLTRRLRAPETACALTGTATATSDGRDRHAPFVWKYALPRKTLVATRSCAGDTARARRVACARANQAGPAPRASGPTRVPQIPLASFAAVGSATHPMATRVTAHAWRTGRQLRLQARRNGTALRARRLPRRFVHQTARPPQMEYVTTQQPRACADPGTQVQTARL